MPETPKADAPKVAPATQSPSPAPAPKLTISVKGDLVFEVVHDKWQHLPRGTRKDEKGWGGPANVARLVDAGCLAVVA